MFDNIKRWETTERVKQNCQLVQKYTRFTGTAWIFQKDRTFAIRNLNSCIFISKRKFSTDHHKSIRRMEKLLSLKNTNCCDFHKRNEWNVIILQTLWWWQFKKYFNLNQSWFYEGLVWIIYFALKFKLINLTRLS